MMHFSIKLATEFSEQCSSILNLFLHCQEFSDRPPVTLFGDGRRASICNAVSWITAKASTSSKLLPMFPRKYVSGDNK